MIDEGIDPLPTSPMLFGGSYDLAFRPDLFRTHFDRPFEEGQIAILETQGKYKNIWLDINRTAHIGKPTKEYIEQHDIVKKCFLDVVSRLKPGNNSSEICSEAREKFHARLTHQISFDDSSFDWSCAARESKSFPLYRFRLCS